MQSFDVRKLTGWKQDTVGIRQTAAEVGSIRQVARGLVGGERRDAYLFLPLLACKPLWRRGSQGLGDCYAEGTIIFGKQTKPIEDVVVGDVVWSGTGELTKVISTKSQVSTKPLITITPWGGIPLKVTEDHKILVYRMRRVGGKRVTANYARREKERSVRSKQNAKWVLDRPNAVIDCFNERKAVWVTAGELRDTDCLLTPLTFEKGKVPDQLAKIWSTMKGRYLLGYLLGDGYVDRWGAKLSCASPEFANRLTKIAVRLGLQARVRKHSRSQCWDVVIQNMDFAAICRPEFYDENSDKVFPAWAVGDSAFLAGLWAADGFICRKVNGIDSTSASVAYGAFNSLLMLGKQPTISVSDRKGQKGVFKNAKPLHRVLWRKHKEEHRIWKDEKYLCRPIRKIEINEGPHKVYDIGVEHESHSIIANGVVGHNCVSWGAELAATLLMANDAIAGTGSWIEEAATESIYGGCRVEALGKTRGGRSDGAFGYAAAKWLKEWGVTLRIDYSKDTGNKEHDLRKYNAKKAKEWGDFGCGGSADKGKLDAVAKQHPVEHIAQVKTVEEAIAALQNYYPITIASMAGFGDMKRDDEGMCYWVNQWAHQMALSAIKWVNGKPRFRVMQSWGDSCSGPDPGIAELLPKTAGNDGASLYLPSSATNRADFIRRLILPDEAFPYHVESAAEWNPISACSWWIDERTLARILQTGDCWSIAGVQGFEPRKLNVKKAVYDRLGLAV